MLAPQPGQPVRIANGRGVGELPLDLVGARECLVQPVAEAQLSFPYFWRNRSTRPAVSISFCFPVKKGWQAEQMSVWISACVERVTKVFPQAHFTVAVA
jgi:hypothetical protein